MNEQLLKTKHESFIYKLKEGTSSSYYLSEGRRNVLPERLGFSKDGFKEITQKGRAVLDCKVGQIVGSYKQKEESCYKLFSPYNFYSTIWQAKDYPLFIGYGDVGVTKENKKVGSTKDLFIIYSPEKGILEVHLFKGLLEFKDAVLAYLKDCVLKNGKSPRMGS